MLTQQDLAQIASLIASNNQQLSTIMDGKLQAMETRLDTKIDSLSAHIDGIDKKVDNLDEKIRHNGVLLEALDSKVQLIYENQVTIIDHDKRQDDFGLKLENHDIRLFAVEQAVKIG